MNYRTATLLAETTLSGSGTKTIAVNLRDIISRIAFYWQVTQSGYDMDSYAHADIAKIELVDGSDVLFSMDGGECQALCIYDRKCPTMNRGWYNNGNEIRSFYGIDFGRWLFDPVLALDPSKFRNLQLKISYDSDVCDEDATEGELCVWAECFDEKAVSPVGFLMAKEHHSWSLTAAGVYEYVELPIDYPLRKMLIQGYLKAKEPWVQVAEARIDEDNEKRIPFDWNLENYYEYMKGIWTPVIERVYLYATDAADLTYYTTPTNYGCPVLLNPLEGNTSVGPVTIMQGGYFKAQAVTPSMCVGMVEGFCPNHCFEFAFGDQKDIEDWYDVTKLGSLRLRLKSGTGTSGDVNTILQQLRRY